MLLSCSLSCTLEKFWYPVCTQTGKGTGTSGAHSAPNRTCRFAASSCRKVTILEIADANGSVLAPAAGMAGIVATGGSAPPAGRFGSAATVGSGVVCFSSLPKPVPVQATSSCLEFPEFHYVMCLQRLASSCWYHSRIPSMNTGNADAYLCGDRVFRRKSESSSRDLCVTRTAKLSN